MARTEMPDLEIIVAATLNEVAKILEAGYPVAFGPDGRVDLEDTLHEIAGVCRTRASELESRHVPPAANVRTYTTDDRQGGPI